MRRYFANALSLGTLVQLAAFSCLWLIITEGISGSWLIGLPVVLLLLLILPGKEEEEAMPLSLSPLGIVSFLPFFLSQSVLSGFDVAWRALRRDMGLHPALLPYSMRLPEGAPRRLFINTITLMPGTLSVEVRGDTVLVHVLDERQPVQAGLERLESLAGSVFGVAPQNREGL